MHFQKNGQRAITNRCSNQINEGLVTASEFVKIRVNSCNSCPRRRRAKKISWLNNITVVSQNIDDKCEWNSVLQRISFHSI